MTREVTLISKGRVTLPKELRASLGLEPGTKLTFSQLADSTVVMRVKHQKLSDLAGRVAPLVALVVPAVVFTVIAVKITCFLGVERLSRQANASRG
jgi:antitoxin PrlF